MSAFGKKGTRCDFCGKFSKNRTTGEYIRKDGSCGYIWPAENELPDGKPGQDICDDCLELKRPNDPSDQVWVSQSGSVSPDLNFETNERQTLYVRPKRD